MSKESHSQTGWIYSIVGVILVLAIVFVVNRLVGASGMKVDLTEKGLYTLSDGTKNILGELDTPVTVRFYATKDSDLVGPIDKDFIKRVEDLLREFRKAAPKGKLKLEFIDPEPFSEEVDDARYNGMQAFTTRGGEEIFRGITIEQLEQRFAIPAIQPSSEPMLEYEIARAISQFGDRERPVIGLMSDLALGGYTAPQQPQQPFMQQRPPQSSPSWLIYDELQRSFRVREFSSNSPQKIGEEVKTLVIVHPNSITKEVEYEIDQYLLRGGNVVAFLDAYAMVATLPPRTGNSSNLPTLLPAWGWSFESASVVVDDEFGMDVNGVDVVRPADLLIPRSGINEAGPVTEQLQSLNFHFAGAFYPEDTAPEGIKKEVLVRSSTSSGTASPFEVQAFFEQLRTAAQSGRQFDRFKIDHSGKNFVLGVRLSGKFGTAFPEGRPAEDDPGSEEVVDADNPEKKEEEEKPVDKDHLNTAVKESVVVLFSDADMIYDEFVASILRVQGGGRLITGYLNSNLAMAQGFIDQLAGDMNLIKVRSRGSVSRPFTTFEEMKEKAGQQKREELDKINKKYNELTAELNKSVQKDDETGQKFLNSADVQAANQKLREEIKKIGKTRRELDRDLRREIKKESVKIQVYNIVLVPLAVLIVGIIHLVIRRRRMSAV